MHRATERGRAVAARGLLLTAFLGLATQLVGAAAAQTPVLASQDTWVGKKYPDDTHSTSTTIALRGPEHRSDAKESGHRLLSVQLGFQP